MDTQAARITVVETLDVRVAEFVERALRSRGIVVWRDRVTIPLVDARLSQQGVRLQVAPGDEATAKQLFDDVMTRRAKQLSFGRPKRGFGTDDGGGGGGPDLGSLGVGSGGDCSDGGCGCD